MAEKLEPCVVDNDGTCWTHGTNFTNYDRRLCSLARGNMDRFDEMGQELRWKLGSNFISDGNEIAAALRSVAQESAEEVRAFAKELGCQPNPVTIMVEITKLKKAESEAAKMREVFRAASVFRRGESTVAPLCAAVDAVDALPTLAPNPTEAK